jgi:hypothetical protein
MFVSNITGVYNDVFRPYMWAIIRLLLEFQLRLYKHTCSGLRV